MTLPLCLEHPDLLALRARVLDVAQVEGGHAVLLDRLPFHPGGGGQPPDGGTVDGQSVLGFLPGPGGPRVLLARPPATETVAVQVDAARRLDQSQQHTAQHLLTALAAEHLGRATVGFHLPETGPGTVDLSGDPLSDAELRALEALADGAVRASRPVRGRVVAPEDLPGLPVRTRGLPDGHTGPVRLVEIEGIDLNTCGGTHVASLGELQAVRILALERIRGGVNRLHYAAGARLLAHVDAALERERAFNRLLSRGPDGHLDAVERMAARERDAARDRRRLLEELAALLGAALPTEDGVAALHRDAVDPTFLGLVANAALAADPARLVLCTATDPEGTGLFLLAGAPDRVAAEGPVVAGILGGRGGGPRGRFQGRAPRLSALPEALSHLRRSRS